MAIDLKKNSESLLAAWKEVSNTGNKTDWALFGYEGQTNTLKLVEKGDGGLEELVDELNSGKIMYAYCAIQDPNTTLTKYVLINWQGEGTPEIKKGACARHVRDVQNFFRGAHVTINARTDEDVDPDVITDKVAKSSGSNYSFHKEAARPVPEPKPVGSVYKKTLPQVEIRAKTRDQFWEQTERAEKQRIEDEKRKKAQEFVQLDKERREREEREEADRDKQVRERMQKVHRMKSVEQAANENSREEEKKRWEAEQQSSIKDDEERRKRSEMMRKERAAEAASLVGGKTKNVRSVFEQKPRSMFDEPEEEQSSGRTAPPSRKLKHAFLNEQEAPAKPERKQPIKLPSEEEAPPSPVHEPMRREPSPPSRQPEPIRTQPSPPPEPIRREPSPPPLREPEIAAAPASVQAEAISSPVSSTPQTRNLLKDGLPRRQDSDDEQEADQDWDEPSSEQYETPDVVPTISASAAAAAVEVVQDAYEEEIYANEEIDTVVSAQPPGDNGLCARALYDYQAADDTEITFDPDDIITQIEQIDPGWWRGVGPDGGYGLFPANYVELINE